MNVALISSRRSSRFTRTAAYKSHLFFLCSSCLRQPAPCSPVICEQVVMTCRGWSPATCLSLATGLYHLTVAPRAANQGGVAAVMNWKLHKWVFYFLLPQLNTSIFLGFWDKSGGEWDDVIVFLAALLCADLNSIVWTLTASHQLLRYRCADLMELRGIWENFSFVKASLAITSQLTENWRDRPWNLTGAQFSRQFD